jgi:hypothetical protein
MRRPGRFSRITRRSGPDSVVRGPRRHEAGAVRDVRVASFAVPTAGIFSGRAIRESRRPGAGLRHRTEGVAIAGHQRPSL